MLRPAQVVRDRRDEVRRVLAELKDVEHLLLSFFYGTGMRLLEGLRLRVKDIEFSLHQILVRDGKGAKDRVNMLPVSLAPALQDHLQRVKQLFERDRREGRKGVALPYALERKYPRAGEEWPWQWVFPAPDLHETLEAEKPAGTISMSAGSREPSGQRP
jgi:integrase